MDQVASTPLADVSPRLRKFVVPDGNNQAFPARWEACRNCVQFRKETAGIEQWCNRFDDDPKAARNCADGKFRRWQHRLSKADSRCIMWRPDLIEEYKQVLTTPVEPPAELSGDGVLFATWENNNKADIGVMIGCHLLRELGWQGRIQLWHCGHVPPLDAAWGVEVFDARKVARETGDTYHMWGLKAFAMRHSGIARVLWLDWDAYCIVDPSPLFATLEKAPFYYWRNGDKWKTHNWNFSLDKAVTPNELPLPVQGGHFLLDCANPMGWRMLAAQCFVDSHHREFWQHIGEDQGGWRMTMAALDNKQHICGEQNPYIAAAWVPHHNGKPVIVHRCGGKLFSHSQPTWHPRLPMESRVSTLFTQFSARIDAGQSGSPVVSLPSREETQDERIDRLRAERGRDSVTVSPSIHSERAYPVGVTLVTALYHIGYRTPEQYRQWFHETLQIQCPMVVYVGREDETLVKTARNDRPTQIVIQELHDIPHYRYYDQVKRILESPAYRKQMRDTNRIECRNPLHSIVNLSKLWWLDSAIQQDTFSSQCAFWIDAGFSRFSKDLSRPFPGVESSRFLALLGDRFCLQHQDYEKNKQINRADPSYLWDNRSLFAGATFGGTATAIRRTKQQVDDIHQRMLSEGCVNNEQVILGHLSAKHPNDYHCVHETRYATSIYDALAGHSHSRSSSEKPPVIQRSNNPITVVTALYDIGYRTIAQYREWFAKTLQLRCPMVVFVGPDNARFVRDARRDLPTKIVVQALDSIPYYRYLKQFSTILRSPDYRARMKNTKRIECNNPLYAIVQFSKYSWLMAASNANPFSSRAFIWMDAGLSRFVSDFPAEFPGKMAAKLLDSAGDRFLINDDQRLEQDRIRVDHLWNDKASVTGAIFGGSGIAVERVTQAFHSLVLRMLDMGCVNSGQVTLGHLALIQPELFMRVTEGKSPRKIFDALTYHAHTATH